MQSYISIHTNGHRRLAVLELAQRGMAWLHAQSVAHALDQLGVRRPAEDDGAAHGGRPDESEILVVSEIG